MLICSMAPMLVLLLTQSGWAISQAQPREVGRTYWELKPEMEVWVRLVPESADGKAPAVNLVFHAFFPGRAARDPYTGLPAWPKGEPARLTLSAEPLPQVQLRELSLRLVIDGRTIELTGASGKHWQLPCPFPENCIPSGVEAEVEPSVVRSVASGKLVGAWVLGYPVRLLAGDQEAVREFASKCGLSLVTGREQGR